MKKKYITRQKLTELLNLQTSEHRKFGTIALEAGVLNEEQLHELLEIQSQNHLYLGTVLVRNGIIGPSDLKEYLDLYRNEKQSLSDGLRSRIDELPHSELLYVSLEMIRSFFFRLGFVVKTDSMRDGVPPEIEGLHLFLGELRLSHREVVYFGPALPDSIESLILSKHLHDDNTRSVHETIRDLEDLEQIFFTLSFALCRDLRSAKIPARLGPIRTWVPKGFRATTFRLSRV